MLELQPRMRAGDKDRQRVVEQLGKHFAEGRLPADPQPRYRRRSKPQMRVPAFLFVLIALFLAWSMVAAVVNGAPPLFALFLVFLLLRHRRWSRRW